MVFVIDQQNAREYFYCIFIDETTLNTWGALKKRTWTDDYSVNLPIQAQRGHSITVIGAIGSLMD